MIASFQDAVGVNVLMYHSISNSSGPTSVPPEIFKIQIETLAACAYRTVSLASFKAWATGETDLPPRSIVLTFDDGFADFAECAFPILKTHKFTATVFLPSGRMGKTENWQGSAVTPRRLMSWSQVADLAHEHIDFGGHSVTHSDLTNLTAVQLEHEIRQCRSDIEQHLGRAPLAFAPPYGRARQRERDEIRKWFELSLGTRLDRAVPNCDRFQIPRIEMHYFRDPGRWQKYLEGSGEWYLAGRRALRSLRGLVVT